MHRAQVVDAFVEFLGIEHRCDPVAHGRQTRQRSGGAAQTGRAVLAELAQKIEAGYGVGVIRWFLA